MKHKFLFSLRAVILLLVMCLSIGDVWGAETGDVFTKITAISELSDGDEVIFVNSGGTSAMSTTQNNNNRGSVTITTSNNSWTYPSNTTVQVLVVKKVDSSYGFHTGSGYLYSAATNNNYLKTTTTAISTAPSGTSLWSLSIATSGNTNKTVTIRNGTNTSYYIQWNGTTVSQYKNTQTNSCIYKKGTSPTLTTSGDAISNNTIAFGSQETSTTGTKTFTLSGSNLTANASLAISGTNATMFSVEPTSVTQTSGTITGQTITVKYTPTAAGDHTAKLTISSTGATSKELTLNGTGIQKHTVTWSVNGVTTTEQVAEGSAITFSTPTENIPTGKVFTGWTSSPIDGTQQSAPKYVTSATMGTSDITYYAVFATASVGTDYTQISSEDNLEAGGRYLIVGYASSTYKALPVDKATSLTTVTPASSKISSPDAELVWTLEGSADKWKIKSVSNNKYLQIDNSSLSFENSTSLTFSVEVSSSVFKFTSSATSGSKVLSYYSSQSKFNAYSSSNTVYVYKASIDYSDYCTSAAASHTVTLNTNGGTIADGKNVTSYSEGTAKDLPTASDITKTGNTFQGWFDNSNCEGKAVTQIPSTATTNVEYWAKWQVNSYTLTWTLNDGVPQGTAGTDYTAAGSVQYGATLTAPVLTKTGHSYVWDPTVPATMPAANATYEAVWTPKSYTIIYKDKDNAAFSGTSWKSTHPTTHTYGTATPLVEPIKANYTFNGWFTASDCSGSKITELGATAFTDNITLYAKWKENAKYTITFVDEVQGTDCTGHNMTNAYVGTQIVFPSLDDVDPAQISSECEKLHYHFYGWVLDGTTPTMDPDNVIKAGDNTKTVSSNATYKAVWVKEDNK